jgi:3-dehydroquinate dehydratase II
MTQRSRRGAPAVTGRPNRAPRVPARRRGTRAAGIERVLVLSGPNLDRLGRREPAIYGTTTLSAIHDRLGRLARELGAEVVCRQSNHEGHLIDWINAAADDGFAGILLNAGSLTHTSYALYDALRGAEVPAIEVHVSNPDAREPFRRRSLIAPACVGRISGFGAQSYALALSGLLEHLRSQKS